MKDKDLIEKVSCAVTLLRNCSRADQPALFAARLVNIQKALDRLKPDADCDPESGCKRDDDDIDSIAECDRLDGRVNNVWAEMKREHHVLTTLQAAFNEHDKQLGELAGGLDTACQELTELAERVDEHTRLIAEDHLNVEERIEKLTNRLAALTPGAGESTLADCSDLIGQLIRRMNEHDRRLDALAPLDDTERCDLRSQVRLLIERTNACGQQLVGLTERVDVLHARVSPEPTCGTTEAPASPVDDTEARRLDTIFAMLDEWLLADEFGRVRNWLECVGVGTRSSAQLLTILSATHKAIPHLMPEYERFFWRAHDVICERDGNAGTIIGFAPKWGETFRVQPPVPTPCEHPVGAVRCIGHLNATGLWWCLFCGAKRVGEEEWELPQPPSEKAEPPAPAPCEHPVENHLRCQNVDDGLPFKLCLLCGARRYSNGSGWLPPDANSAAIPRPTPCEHPKWHEGRYQGYHQDWISARTCDDCFAVVLNGQWFSPPAFVSEKAEVADERS